MFLSEIFNCHLTSVMGHSSSVPRCIRSIAVWKKRIELQVRNNSDKEGVTWQMAAEVF